MKTKQPSTGPLWLFPVLWILGTVTVLPLAGLLFNFPFGDPPFTEVLFRPESLLGGLVNGVLAGILIGGIQALILRLEFQGVRRWFIVTAVVLCLIHMMAVVLPGDAVWVLVILMGGIYLGAMQTWALHPGGTEGTLLVVSTSLAWPFGLFMGEALAPFAAPWLVEQTYITIGAGLLLAISSGVILMWSLRSQPDRGVAATTSALPTG